MERPRSITSTRLTSPRRTALTDSFGASEVAVYPTLQTDGTYQGTVSVESNWLESDVPAGSSDVSVAIQNVYAMGCALTPAQTPLPRQNAFSGGKPSFKIVSGAWSCRQDGSSSNPRSNYLTSYVFDISGVFSRKAKYSNSGAPMDQPTTYGWGDGSITYQVRLSVTRSANAPKTIGYRFKTNIAYTLTANASGTDSISTYGSSAVGSATCNSGPGSNVVSPPATLGPWTGMMLATLGSDLTTTIPIGSLGLPLVNAVGGVEGRSASCSSTACHKLHLYIGF